MKRYQACKMLEFAAPIRDEQVVSNACVNNGCYAEKTLQKDIRGFARFRTELVRSALIARSGPGIALGRSAASGRGCGNASYAGNTPGFV